MRVQPSEMFAAEKDENINQNKIITSAVLLNKPNECCQADLQKLTRPIFYELYVR